APPSRASDDDQVGILQQPAPAPPPALAAPQQTGPRVYTNQYGWVWMPYGQQYVDEGTYGASSPYQYVYCVGLGWSWVAAPWLWGWGAYPYFGVWGPSHFAWYRGLYREGYGWGRYRGGAPPGGGYHATSPSTRGLQNIRFDRNSHQISFGDTNTRIPVRDFLEYLREQGVEERDVLPVWQSGANKNRSSESTGRSGSNF